MTITESRITIRPYQAEDDERLIMITKLAWPEVTIWKKIEDRYGPRGGKSWWHYKITPLLNFARSHPEQFLVAQWNNEVVGYAMYTVDPETKIGEVHDNAVDPAWQGRGIGSALHRQVLLNIKDAGMEIIMVCTGVHQVAARTMYEKFGFQEVFPKSIFLMHVSEAKL